MKKSNLFKQFFLIFIFFLVFSVKVSAASGEVVDITVDGTFDYTKAQEVLTIVNEERKNQGLHELQMDRDLMESAMIRAMESSLYFDHTRPNGKSCFTISSKAFGENIAAGRGTAEGVMDQWMNSAGHRSNILDSDYNSIGIGAFKNGAIYYWVQLFGFSNASDESNKTGTISTQRSVSMLKSLVSVYGYTIKDGSFDGYLQPGETGYTMYGVKNQGWDGVFSLGVASDYNFTSSNNKVISMNEKGEFKAVSVGTATVSACLKADSTMCFKEDILVKYNPYYKKNGVFLNNTTGKYEFYTDDKIDTTFTGLKKVDTTWYYFTKGIQDSTYNGVATNEFGTWYVNNGTITRKHCEVVYYNNEWVMFLNSKLDKAYTGLGKNKSGTWYVEKGIVTKKYNGIYKDTKGKYYVITNSKVDSLFTGLKKIDTTWYYFTKGIQDSTYNGIATNEFGTWYVNNGTITRKHNEVVYYNNNWVMFLNSKLDRTYTGLGKNKSGTWYVEKGIVTKKYNGIYKDTKGKYYVITNSKVDPLFTGLKKIGTTWYYFTKGIQDKTYNGVATNEFGIWHVNNGTITRKHNEVVKYNNIWVTFINSKLDYSYTGLCSNAFGTWYAEKGIVSKKYNGTYTDKNGKTYTIQNSKVIK